MRGPSTLEIRIAFYVPFWVAVVHSLDIFSILFRNIL